MNNKLYGFGAAITIGFLIISGAYCFYFLIDASNMKDNPQICMNENNIMYVIYNDELIKTTIYRPAKIYDEGITNFKINFAPSTNNMARVVEVWVKASSTHPQEHKLIRGESFRFINNETFDFNVSFPKTGTYKINITGTGTYEHNITGPYITDFGDFNVKSNQFLHQNYFSTLQLSFTLAILTFTSLQILLKIIDSYEKQKKN